MKWGKKTLHLYCLINSNYLELQHIPVNVCTNSKTLSSYISVFSKRVRTQSQLSEVGPAGLGQGQVNAGYVTDGQTSKTDGFMNQTLRFLLKPDRMPLFMLGYVLQLWFTLWHNQIKALALVSVHRCPSKWTHRQWLLPDSWLAHLWGKIVCCSVVRYGDQWLHAEVCARWRRLRQRVNSSPLNHVPVSSSSSLMHRH